MNKILAFILLGLSVGFCFAQKPITTITSKGVMVVVPAVGGPKSYATYLMPKEAQYLTANRSMYGGNPIRVQFVDAREILSAQSITEEQLLAGLFLKEQRELAKGSGAPVTVRNEKNQRGRQGELFRSATVIYYLHGVPLEKFVTSRVVGRKVMAVSVEKRNSATYRQACRIGQQILESVQFYPRVWTAEEARILGFVP